MPNKEGGPEEEAALKALKERLGYASGYRLPENVRVPDEETALRRFCRARQNRVDKSYEMLTKHVAWRERNDMDSVIARTLKDPRLPQLFKYYPHGHHGTDVQGRPVYIQQSCKIDFKGLMDHFTMDELVDMHLSNMEFQSRVLFSQASAYKGFPVHKTCNILDMDGVGPGYLFGKAMELVKRCAAVDADNYPESLAVAYLVNTPRVFVWVWRAISVFFDPVTKEKINFCGSVRHPHTKKLLSDALGGADKVPAFLGGECRCGCITGPGEGCSGDKPSKGHRAMIKWLEEQEGAAWQGGDAAVYPADAGVVGPEGVTPSFKGETLTHAVGAPRRRTCMPCCG